MLTTQVKSYTSKGWDLVALCPECNNTWEFFLGTSAKTTTKICPSCKKSHRFKKPVIPPEGRAPEGTPSEVQEHQEIDGEQQKAVLGIMDDLEEAAQEMVKKMTDKERAEMEKTISALVPQKEVFGLVFETLLQNRLPPARVLHYSSALSIRSDLLFRKYGYDNILGEYLLEISTALMLVGLFKEMKAHKTETPPGAPQTPSLEDEARASIER